jgi:hypothetical protein
MLYTIVLELHSIVRWLIILAALFAIIRALTGLSFRRGWMKMDDQAGLWFTMFLDIQVLLGIILYFFLSPFTKDALINFSVAMSDPTKRFFSVEHIAGMIIAVVVAHVGRALSRKAPTAIQKHRRALIWFALAVLIILASIPWPFLSYGRPWI